MDAKLNNDILTEQVKFLFDTIENVIEQCKNKKVDTEWVQSYLEGRLLIIRKPGLWGCVHPGVFRGETCPKCGRVAM